jgi:hypothetical protein
MPIDTKDRFTQKKLIKIHRLPGFIAILSGVRPEILMRSRLDKTMQSHILILAEYHMGSYHIPEEAGTIDVSIDPATV